MLNGIIIFGNEIYIDEENPHYEALDFEIGNLFCHR